MLHRPQKNVIPPIFCTNLRQEAPLPVYFSCTTFRRSATTSATLLIPKCTTRRWTLRCSNYSVAKRQQFSCALSTATLSLKFENVVPEGWILIFPALYLSNIFTAVRARTSTSRGIFFFFSGSCSQETSMLWYHMIRNVFFVVFWGTLLRLTAGAVVLIPKCTTLQSVPWLCASIQEELYAISLWLSTATSAVNIA